MKFFIIENNTWKETKLTKDKYNWHWIELFDDNLKPKGMGLYPAKQYKTCDRCCYDILDNYGDIIEHYCIDNELY